MKTLGLFYFIPREYLTEKPPIELFGEAAVARPDLKKRFFVQDGLIGYDHFPLELPVSFAEDRIRFRATVPGTFLVFLN
ncbi:hypothetical protein ACFPMF_04390 [Larkinella bovis]|uniref:Uncharacterized protein n=1 Tax=Larkinella bovis TaxID=683041 RepID=A0ABW0IB30_9BACT